jgi:hypothetical protein
MNDLGVQTALFVARATQQHSVAQRRLMPHRSTLLSGSLTIPGGCGTPLYEPS